MANPYEFGGAYGAYTDEETTLLKIGARYYDPVLGRSTQQDLLAGNAGNPKPLNRYAYAGCNAVNYSDPSGLSPLSDCIALGIPAAIGGAIIGALATSATGAGVVFSPAGAALGAVVGFNVVCWGILFQEFWGLVTYDW